MNSLAFELVRYLALLFDALEGEDPPIDFACTRDLPKFGLFLEKSSERCFEWKLPSEAISLSISYHSCSLATCVLFV